MPHLSFGTVCLQKPCSAIRYIVLKDILRHSCLIAVTKPSDQYLTSASAVFCRHTWRFIDLLIIIIIIQTGTIQKLGCGFLFVFHGNYGSILHHFQDKEILVENCDFFITPFHFVSPLGQVPVGILPSHLVGLPDSEKSDDTFSHLDRIPACDRRTDILPRHSLRYAYASCGKNHYDKHIKY